MNRTSEAGTMPVNTNPASARAPIRLVSLLACGSVLAGMPSLAAAQQAAPAPAEKEALTHPT